MVYKTRPGVILIKICGVDILAATRQAWEECPMVRPIPRIWAACWSLMEKGRTSDDVMKFFIRFFHKPEEDVRSMLGTMFEKLYQEGFLIAVEEDL